MVNSQIPDISLAITPQLDRSLKSRNGALPRSPPRSQAISENLGTFSGWDFLPGDPVHSPTGLSSQAGENAPLRGISSATRAAARSGQATIFSCSVPSSTLEWSAVASASDMAASRFTCFGGGTANRNYGWVTSRVGTAHRSSVGRLSLAGRREQLWSKKKATGKLVALVGKDSEYSMMIMMMMINRNSSNTINIHHDDSSCSEPPATAT